MMNFPQLYSPLCGDAPAYCVICGAPIGINDRHYTHSKPHFCTDYYCYDCGRTYIDDIELEYWDAGEDEEL